MQKAEKRGELLAARSQILRVSFLTGVCLVLDVVDALSISILIDSVRAIC